MRLLKNFGVLTLLSGLLMMGSCTIDECADVVCYNDGVCVDGDCDCVFGYEGDDCTTEMRQKFYGDYDGTITFAGGSNQATVYVTSYAGNVLRMWVDNDFYLELSGSKTVNVPTQYIPDSTDPFYISGYGSVNGDLMTLTLEFEYLNGVTVPVTFSGVK